MAIICNVPNREYVSALRQCAKEHENENLFTGQIDTTALCNDTAKLLENDVIERSIMEILCNEYLSKCNCCDECCAETYCILNSLRTENRDCVSNLITYFSERNIGE